MNQEPHQSPIPAMRNRFTVPSQPQVIIPSRSPMPTPRNVHNIRSVDSTGVVQTPSAVESGRSNQNHSAEQPRSLQVPSVESPSVRRRTEPPTVHRNDSLIQTFRTRVEPSPTALLIHKLFRNRDPRLLPSPSELQPLAPINSRATRPPASELHIAEETIYAEIPTAPVPTLSDGLTLDRDDDDSSVYLSIDNLNLSLENPRTGSNTPPPPYRSIFDDDDRSVWLRF